MKSVGKINPGVFAVAAVLIMAASCLTGVKAASAVTHSCTKADRGISFGCPGTPTEDVCGDGPSYTCYDGASEPCDFAKYTFSCSSCACQCKRAQYPCGTCDPANSTVGGSCALKPDGSTNPNCPTGGVWGDVCSSSPTCPGGQVKCQNNNNPAPGRCVVNNAAKCNSIPGTTWDSCTDQCISPYILRSPAEPQADATVDVVGDILAGGNISSTGDVNVGNDLYINGTKAVHVDYDGPAWLQVGNWVVSDQLYSLNLNVLGNVLARDRIGVGAGFQDETDVPEYPIDVKSYSLGLGSGMPENTAIVNISDMSDGSPGLWTGVRLGRGLDPYTYNPSGYGSLEKWFIGMNDYSDDLRLGYTYWDQEGYSTQTLLLTPRSGADPYFGHGTLITSEDSYLPTFNGYIQLANRPTVSPCGSWPYQDCPPGHPDFAGVDGTMYYNTSMAKFRCLEDGEWQNCVTSGGLGGAGQGSEGQVAVWRDDSSVFGSPEFVWDDTNKLLGIGTTDAPSANLSVKGDGTIDRTVVRFEQDGQLPWYGDGFENNVLKVYRDLSPGSSGLTTGAIMSVEDSGAGGSLGDVLEVKANNGRGRGIYSQSLAGEAGYFEQAGNADWNSTAVVKIVRNLQMASTSSGPLLSLENNSDYTWGALLDISNKSDSGSFWSDYVKITDNADASVFNIDRAGTVSIAGTARMSGFEMAAGSSAGYVLTSNGAGVGTWQPGPGTVDECVGGKYHHVTTANYNGVGIGGYTAAAAKCQLGGAANAGTHMCSTEELMRTIVCAAATVTGLTSSGWVNNGPPGYTANASNDCIGWSAAAGAFGDFWQFNVTGGKGFATSCASSLPIICCKNK